MRAYRRLMVTFIDLYPPQQRHLARNELADDEIEAGAYFGLTDITNRKPYGVWHFDGQRAVQIGIANPDYRSSFTLSNGCSLREEVTKFSERAGTHFVIHKMELAPGAFYPRISRPSDQYPTESPGGSPSAFELGDQLIGSLSQLRSLVGMLDDIFQSVHPVPENLACFGSNTRNLIILASSECEAQWAAVLRANAYKSARAWNRNDYQKLVHPMKLDEYGVTLAHYPWLGPQTPFAGWRTGPDGRAPLTWYDDYNAVKHDREGNFARASLSTAIRAVTACWIMIAAQFGQHALREFDDLWRYFRLAEIPAWRFSHVYCHAYSGHEDAEGPVPYPFNIDA